MFLAKALLCFLILYIPYQLHLPTELGLKGLNVFNVLFIIAWLLTMAAPKSPDTHAPLKGRFTAFFLALITAYFFGILSDGSTIVDDLTVLKNSIFYMMLFFLYHQAVNSLATARLFITILLGVAVLASLEMLREAIDYGIGSYNETHRVAGPFGPYNFRASNLAAVYLVMHIPLLASIAFLYRSRTLYRLTALFSLFLCTAAVFFTGSRQAYFILMFLGVLLALRRGALAALIAVALIVGYESWLPESTVQRIQMTEQTDDFGETKLDESTESRFVQWTAAMELVKERPWGIGLNHFQREIGRFSSYSNLDAHNFYVLILTEAGVQGLLALLVLLFGLYRLTRGYHKFKDLEEARVLGLGFTLSFFGMLLSNIYGSRFLTGQVMGNFWILAAVMTRYYDLLAAERLAGEKTPGETEAAPAGQR